MIGGDPVHRAQPAAARKPARADRPADVAGQAGPAPAAEEDQAQDRTAQDRAVRPARRRTRVTGASRVGGFSVAG